MKKRDQKTKPVFAFAPASVGNVGVGFDVLGLALDGVGDVVELAINRDSRAIVIEGMNGESDSIPHEADKNTAGAALLAMQQDLNLPYGYNVRLYKGIPLGSGMGGSAASAVAAVVAGAALAKQMSRAHGRRANSISLEQLFIYALEGERIVSCSAHPDNVAPSLYGGLTLSSSLFSKPVRQVSLPKGLVCALVHPDIKVETKQARQILRSEVHLQSYVHQSSLLAGFVLGCATRDLKLMGESLRDLIIEPQRQHLIPAFDKIKANACAINGCLGFSISGSGPSVFALAKSQAAAQKIAREIYKQFELAGVTSQIYISRLPAKGARICSSPTIHTTKRRA